MNKEIKKEEVTIKNTYTLSFENQNKKLVRINTIAKDEKEARSHFSILIYQDFNSRAEYGRLPDKCIVENKGKKKYSFDEYYKLFNLLSVNKVELYGDGGNKALINGESI